MRTVLLVAWIVFTIPLPTLADDYAAPPIVVSGQATELLTKKWVLAKYREIKPVCILLAQELPLSETEDERSYRSRRDERYVRCMSEAFTPLGLSVVPDVPSLSRN